MSVKITISIPEELKAMVEEYNKRNPFDKLNLSRITQKAVYEKIKTNDSDVIKITRKNISVLKDKTESKEHGLISVVCNHKVPTPLAPTTIVPNISISTDQPNPNKEKEYTCIVCQTHKSSPCSAQ